MAIRAEDVAGRLKVFPISSNQQTVTVAYGLR